MTNSEAIKQITDHIRVNDRKKITSDLRTLLKVHINPYNDTRIYSAEEVTFDYSTKKPIRVDLMVFKPLNNSAGGIEQGMFYCYEIKSCKEDFNSGHGLNFIGDYNYLVMPKKTYEECKDSIPADVGVYIPNMKDFFTPLECVKKAKKKTRKRTAVEMLLMMFRSSNRELLKLKANKEGK